MISIIIINWNSGPLLERCVRSLLKYAGGCQIVIVDNCSEDSSLGFLSGDLGPMEVLRNRHNEGFARASNQGWQAARGEHILFLNPDTESQPGAVANLSGRLDREAELWAVGGRLLDSEGETQQGFNVRAFPTIGAVAAETLLLDEIWPRNPWTRAYRMLDWDPDTPCEVDQPAAACLMVRREALVSLHGFDEIFWPAWFEDVDLCARIRKAGGRIGFEPGARFLHSGGVSLRSLALESFLEYYHTNQIRYFEKHHGRAAAARARRLVILGLYVRTFLASLGVHRGPLRERSPVRSYWRAARILRAARQGGA